MSLLPDVVIIGGGVIGLSTAYYLARAGARVTLVDQGDLGRQASWAGAGIIPPGKPNLARTPYDLLRAHSSAMYPTLSQELLGATGIDNGFVVCGGLEFDDPCEQSHTDEWRSEGIAFREAGPDELRSMRWGLAPELSRAYFLPEMSQVRNPRHLRALEAACKKLGVDLRPGCHVHGLVKGSGKVQSIETAVGPIKAGKYLLSAGAWSDRLLEQVQWRLGICPVRGQIALLNSGEAGVRPLLLMGKRYLVPRTDGRVLIGATEEDAGFDARPTAGGIAGLLEFAASLVPGLAAAPLERCWAGLRPGSPDGLPFLGTVPGYENFFVAAGHFRAGLQLSPATGLVLSELLLERPPSIPLEAFRLDRAAAMSFHAAFRS
jgi:glycine oxidase